MVHSLLTVPTITFWQAAISVVGHSETSAYVSTWPCCRITPPLMTTRWISSWNNRSTGFVVELALLNISLGRQGNSQCYLSGHNVLFRWSPASIIILHVPSRVSIGNSTNKMFHWLDRGFFRRGPVYSRTRNYGSSPIGLWLVIYIYSIYTEPHEGVMSGWVWVIHDVFLRTGKSRLGVCLGVGSCT